MHAIILSLLTADEVHYLAARAHRFASFDHALERFCEFKTSLIRQIEDKQLAPAQIRRALHVACEDRIRIGWEDARLREFLSYPGPENPTAIDIRESTGGRATDHRLYRDVMNALARQYAEQSGDTGNARAIQRELDSARSRGLHATCVAMLNEQTVWPTDSVERTAALRTAFHKVAAAILIRERLRQRVEYECVSLSIPASRYLHLIATEEDLLGSDVDGEALWRIALQLSSEWRIATTIVTQFAPQCPGMQLLIYWFESLHEEHSTYPRRALAFASHSADRAVLEEGYQVALDSGRLTGQEQQLLALSYDVLHIRHPERLVDVANTIEAIQELFTNLAARLSTTPPSAP